MGTIEKKVELTARFNATTESGQSATVNEHTEFIREQLLDRSWTPWLPTTRRFTWGGIALNLREDGNWETAEYEPRRLNRRA